MPKRIRKPDVGVASGEAEASAANEKNPAAVALGRLGGLKGGRARADSLTPRQRSAIARKAAKTRWKKSRPDGPAGE